VDKKLTRLNVPRNVVCSQHYATSMDIVMAIPLLNSSIAVTISTEERQFFIAMGQRITQLRKERNMTQAQLAEALGVAQQTVQAYESGARRIPVSALPTVAHTLSVSLEVLLMPTEN
jgi:DNA-binding XRE family transcriptional regulator